MAPPTEGGRSPALPVIDDLRRYDVQTIGVLPELGRAFATEVSLGGQRVLLDLEPYSMRAADFQVLVQRDADGVLHAEPAPPPATYRGVVGGVEGSRVAASLYGGRLEATIRMGEAVWTIQPLSAYVPGAAADQHISYRLEDIKPHDGVCGVSVDAQPQPIEGQGGGGIAGTGDSQADIAFDADFEYFQLNASNVNNTIADIEGVANGMEFIYERDVDITYEITTMIIRANAADPYSNTTVASTLLGEFRAVWNVSPQTNIRRDTTQLATGRTMQNGILGIAYVGTVCDTVDAYSVTELRFTLSSSSRQALMSHEIGHTWNAPHCDGDGDCHIMCSNLGGCNGISGSNLRFGVNEQAAIEAFRNTRTCLVSLADPQAVPFFDDFPNVVLDTAKWSYSYGSVSGVAFCSESGVNEPSAPRALLLDSQGSAFYQDDEARTNFIDTTGQSELVIEFQTQHRGVEAGESLTVFYRRPLAGGQDPWVELTTIDSDGVDQDNFIPWSFPVPSPTGYHAEFRLRFQVEGNESNDDWFIDNVYVGPSQVLPCPADCDQPPDGVVDVADLLQLLAEWDFDGFCDLDGNNTVDVADLLILLAGWGDCPV
jgi:hypothetical protein